MKTLTTVLAVVVTLIVASVQGLGDTKVGAAIVCPVDTPANVKLAASEIRRYVYLRTATLLPIAASSTEGTAIVLKTDPARQMPNWWTCGRRCP